jgi:hypothetical protein
VRSVTGPAPTQRALPLAWRAGGTRLRSSALPVAARSFADVVLQRLQFECSRAGVRGGRKNSRPSCCHACMVETALRCAHWDTTAGMFANHGTPAIDATGASAATARAERDIACIASETARSESDGPNLSYLKLPGTSRAMPCKVAAGVTAGEGRLDTALVDLAATDMGLISCGAAVALLAAAASLGSQFVTQVAAAVPPFGMACSACTPLAAARKLAASTRNDTTCVAWYGTLLSPVP